MLDFKWLAFFRVLVTDIFPRLKLVSYRVMIHVYSGIRKKKILTYSGGYQCSSLVVKPEKVVNRTFPGSDEAPERRTKLTSHPRDFEFRPVRSLLDATDLASTVRH